MSEQTATHLAATLREISAHISRMAWASLMRMQAPDALDRAASLLNRFAELEADNARLQRYVGVMDAAMKIPDAARASDFAKDGAPDATRGRA